MTVHHEAILFDMGGTLRRTMKRDDEHKSKMVQQILALLGSDAPPMEFAQLLTQRADAYKRWAEKTLIELNEIDLWTQWMLPDWPAEQISKYALQLNQLWREATGTRVIYPEMKSVVSELFRRGYHLGLVSNTVSSTEVPRALQELKISGCFDTIVLSCVFGGRKPDPAILLDATERIGVDPARCAYVGDRPDRDVAASRAAGFSKAIIVRDPEKPLVPSDDPSRTPDHVIDNLMELLELFPSRSGEKAEKSRTARGTSAQAGDSRVYDASLSTMWGIENFPRLNDFFIATQRIGFNKIELNHQASSAMLAGTDLKNFLFSSVHEPCPADISIETLKNRDWLISSTDEECRKQGVAAIKQSIDLAAEIDANVVVVHAGRVAVDGSLENKLRCIFGEGQVQTTEYLETKKTLWRFEPSRLRRI